MRYLLSLILYLWVGPALAFSPGFIATATSCINGGCSTYSDSVLYNSGNTANADTGTGGSWIARPFTSDGDSITGVSSKLRGGVVDIPSTMEIWTDNSGSPGVRVGAGYTATIASLSTSLSTHEFVFASVQTLSAGNYWMVIIPSGPNVIAGYQSSGGTAGKYSNNSGSTWAIGGNTEAIEAGVLGCD